MIRGDWKVTGSELVYDNPWISVNHHKVITPGGSNGIYGEVHFKNLAIGILPLDDNGNTWRVGQFRFPLNRFSWEIPEGGGPLGVDPLESAKRELQEEVGLQAERWEAILELDLSNSVTNEQSIVYLAEGLTQVPTNHEDTENLTIEKIPFSTLYEDVMNGGIRDSISVAAVLKLAILRPGLLKR
ncbi:MAG: NUDIX domain-containing protein [Bacteroidia bacterium]